MNLKRIMTMTNTITKTTPEITPSAPEMDTWEIACAVLTALNQTHIKAMSEYVTLVEAADSNPSGTGVVSVYEDPDGLEGCSRLVPSGQTERLIKYADFDRCAWSSNS